MDFLEGLNPQQREAAAHVEGPLLILAGAGSGKTRVITHRIAHLIHQHGVPGHAILAVTFTNKAAEEMRNRIISLLAKAGESSTPLVSTFHSFCVRLLRRDGAGLAAIRPGFTKTFNIYDDDDQISIIKSIYRALGLDETFMKYRAALSAISHGKNQQETPQDFYKRATDPKLSRLAVIYEKYEEKLWQSNALDFDDLLLESVRLLRHDTTVREAWNRRIQFLMIDEYQDTNRTQYELMRLLTGAKHNVAVVGDEDQSIYGWRGADIRNILDFERDFPNAKVIRLEQNYRSTKNILEAASAVVANNKNRKGKWLWTDSGQGTKIGLYEALDAENEALFIADTIEKFLALDPAERVAVLYRTNFQSRQIEEALRRYGRKYIVVGGFSFYQRAEVKDVLSYLKAVASPQDSISLLRIINVPARGIGKTTVEQIEQYALENGLSVWSAVGRMLDEHMFPGRAEASLNVFRRTMEELGDATKTHNVAEVLRLILDRTGYLQMLEAEATPESETRRENLNELVNAALEAAERGESVNEFLDHAALVSDADQVDTQAQVSLLTMHNAKGLEFPIVFIAGLEEGLFPHSRSVIGTPDAMEEERRLCYVGMTRAEKRLFLTWARSRRKWGGGPSEPSIPSRFLNEVPKDLLDRQRGAAGISQMDLLAERAYVRETARKNVYTGKTYNSVENISQFFNERGVQPAAAKPAVAQAPAAKPALGARPPVKKKPFGAGSTVQHPSYGRGTVLRKEGDGDDTKLTVSFPGYGLKKIIAKYAGIKIDE
jgi:DNA helicase II / ATP-dependent DNA helicase PcrA